MKSLVAVHILLVFLAACQKEVPSQKPNIILIMADDVGIADIGCYGSEIKTPNIDYLANQGLRFQTFYNMAKCNPTRSTLLTGLYKGGAGSVHLAQLTKNAGYTNIMSGKEHFDDWVPDYCKAKNVFDNSLVFWATTEYFIPPSGEFTRPFILNGDTLKAKEINRRIEPAYKTDFITDYALDWLHNARKKDKPYFLYLPYHAAHYPLQARPKDIAKYRNTYLIGWDSLRVKRYQKMRALGIINKETKLSQPTNNINAYRKPFDPAYTNYRPWSSLNSSQKDSLDLEMAVYAAIVDRMDQNIGRIIEDLRTHKELENTLILFMVDNGSCPYQSNTIPDVQPGPANSYWSLRASWANAGNTPFRYYKQFGHEGGSHTPFIAYWPAKIKAKTITSQVGHVVDLAPTFLDILDIPYPKTVNGVETIPLHGSSLLPIFEGKKRKEPAYFISGLENFRMYRKANYKIVKANNSKWELYDLHKDPSETNNLSAQKPNKLTQLVNTYTSDWRKINENFRTK